MPKTFYTERDIEDMARRGILSIDVSDNVVLTELAYEKAQRLGVKLNHGEKPPSAPERPYIAKDVHAKPSLTSPTGSVRSTPASLPAAPASAPAAGSSDLKQKVRDAVIARVGGQVDATLLDTIIRRVLNNVGLK